MDDATRPADQIAAHQRLLRLWSRCGLLVHCGNDGGLDHELLKAIETLPLAMRKLWQESWRHERAEARDLPPLSQVQAEAELATYSPALDVAYFNEARAGLLGLTPEQISRRPASGHPEFGRLRHADQTECFLSAIARLDAPISAGTPIEALWKERFQSLARAVQHKAVLVDRFAVESHLARRDGLSGLHRLMTELKKDLPRRRFTLISALKETSIGEARARLEHDATSWVGSGLEEVEVFLAEDDRRFGRLSHRRYVRFDGAVCTLDVGIEVLEGNTVWRDCDFHMGPRSDVIRDEARLREISRRIIFPAAA